MVTVTAVGFSPVKGTRHLTYDAVELDALGPVADRGYCLIDPAAGRVLRTVQNPALVAVTARLVGRRLDVVLPDGERAEAEPAPTGKTVTCDYWGRSVPLELMSGPHSELFSERLGKPVRLARAPRGGVVFAGPVTIVSTASLADLGARAGAEVEAARFRATVVVEVDRPYEEESWTGRELRLGQASLRVGAPIPRCAVIDIHPVTGLRDGRLLKTLASYRPLNAAGEPAFGMYAEVTRPGLVSTGS